VTGLVDLGQGRLLEVVADRTRAAVDRWLHARTHDWLAGIVTVALDRWRGYASALVVPLGHATVVVDHFHAIRLANTVVDQVRRRTSRPPWGIGPQTRSLVPHPRAAGGRGRAAHQPGTGAAGGRAGRR
jgi:transposase